MLQPYEGEALSARLYDDVNALQAQFSLWQQGTEYEIAYWRRWLSLKGGRYPQDFANRNNPGQPVDGILNRILNEIDAPAPTILDVGAGPITCLGKVYMGTSLSILACDPLAKHYDQLLFEAAIEPLVRTEFANLEDLSFFYEEASFDVVHCQNALDHSFDPLRGIWQMLKICRPGGRIILRHAHNEAENEKYNGFHQWNITIKDKRLCIWNKTHEFDVQECIQAAGEIRIELEDGYCIVSIARNALPLRSDLLDAPARIRSFVRLFVELATSR